MQYPTPSVEAEKHVSHHFLTHTRHNVFVVSVHWKLSDFLIRRKEHFPIFSSIFRHDKNRKYFLMVEKFLPIFAQKFAFKIFLHTFALTNQWWIHLRARIRASHARHRGSNPLSTTKAAVIQRPFYLKLSRTASVLGLEAVPNRKRSWFECCPES